MGELHHIITAISFNYTIRQYNNLIHLTKERQQINKMFLVCINIASLLSRGNNMKIMVKLSERKVFIDIGLPVCLCFRIGRFYNVIQPVNSFGIQSNQFIW